MVVRSQAIKWRMKFTLSQNVRSPTRRLERAGTKETRDVIVLSTGSIAL